MERFLKGDLNWDTTIDLLDFHLFAAAFAEGPDAAFWLDARDSRTIQLC